jgi:DNA-binding FrmR family transcriptional regulator
MSKKVERDEITKSTLLKRLHRIEGQVRGLEKMITDDRDCESLITQMAAVRSAVDSVGALVLNNYMKLCFRKGTDDESGNMDSLARAVSVWGRVRIGDKR